MWLGNKVASSTTKGIYNTFTVHVSLETWSGIALDIPFLEPYTSPR